MTKLLVIGQAPSRAMEDGDPVLWNTKALTLLAKYAGVSPRERLYDLADFVNVIEKYPGPQPGNEKYDYFPRKEARIRAQYLLQELIPHYDQVVLLGSAVRLAFKDALLYKKEPEWFEEIKRGTIRIYCSPHPGGTSMWWNDPKNRVKGSLFWSNVFGKVDSTQRSVAGLPEQSDRRIEMYGL